MDIFGFIGVLAGIFTAVPSVPQIFTTIKSKSAKGLNPIMFCIRLLGGIFWMIYGWSLGSWQMIVFNALSALCSLSMLILIFVFKNK